MAQSGMVRISRASQETLRQLAERTGESMQAVLEKAVDELKRAPKLCVVWPCPPTYEELIHHDGFVA